MEKHVTNQPRNSVSCVPGPGSCLVRLVHLAHLYGALCRPRSTWTCAYLIWNNLDMGSWLNISCLALQCLESQDVGSIRYMRNDMLVRAHLHAYIQTEVIYADVKPQVLVCERLSLGPFMNTNTMMCSQRLRQRSWCCRQVSTWASIEQEEIQRYMYSECVSHSVGISCRGLLVATFLNFIDRGTPTSSCH